MNAWILSPLLTLAVACATPPKTPTATLTVGGTPIVVELAANEADRAQGLMHRKKMDPDKGMLFIYPDDKPRRFWMKNTFLPLSIAFLDREGVILRMADMEPLTTERTPSLYPARYALEMNRGWFDAHEVKVGDTVQGLAELTVAVQ